MLIGDTKATVAMAATPHADGFAVEVAVTKMDPKAVLMALGALHVALEAQIAFWLEKGEATSAPTGVTLN